MNISTRLCVLVVAGTCLVGITKANQSTARPASTPFYRHPSSPAVAADKVDLGTTLVAIRYNQGVVVAADSRTSVGGTYVSNRYAYKLAPITRHCMVLRSGSAADTQQMVAACRQYFRQGTLQFGRGATVQQISHWMRQAVRQRPHGQVSLLVAGFDDDNGGRIYSVALSGALHAEGDFAAAGSGSVFILGFLDYEIGKQQRMLLEGDPAGNPQETERATNNHSSSHLTEAQAIELCQRAIALAARRDGSSGGVARLAVINRDGTRYIEARPAVLSSHDEESSKNAALDRNLPGFAPAIDVHE